jgi:arsenite methyltransferase
VVGPAGRVIGIDMTDDMLEVARRNAPVVAERLGYANVEFRKGRIQDLALDLELLDLKLQEQPIRDAASFLAGEQRIDLLRAERPLVAAGSVDVVVSNCVLNLVESRFKRQMFNELFRVLKEGGRAVISDIVSDGEVPEHLQNDPDLWSGCISGALTAEGFLEAFAAAGFHGIQILKRDEQPWRTVEGIAFRSVTVQAFKAPPVASMDSRHSILYLGPFKEVVDDHGRRLIRGKPSEVPRGMVEAYLKEPYTSSFLVVEPREESPEDFGTPARASAAKNPAPFAGGLKQVLFDPRAASPPGPRSGECCS